MKTAKVLMDAYQGLDPRGALLGALFVGIVEAFGAFWASAFKEVIVFTLILPILLVRSLRSGHSDEEH